MSGATRDTNEAAADGFSADWLTLRRAADGRARSQRLIAQAFQSAPPDVQPMRIVDLGAGTGATLAALSGLDPRRQAWTLVDADPALLARVPAPEDSCITVATRVADLSGPDPFWEEAPHLVTASALFDLAGAPFIDALAAALAEASAPLLAMLSYDGTLQMSPPHGSDTAVRDAFNADQRSGKGLGGTALGPDAAGVLALALTRQNFCVTMVASPWRLTAERDGALIAKTLEGIAQAARERIAPATVDTWLDARLNGTQAITVGHVDLLAIPS